MVIDLGKSDILKRQVAQAIDGVVRCEFASAHLLEKFADGFGVHGGRQN